MRVQRRHAEVQRVLTGSLAVWFVAASLSVCSCFEQFARVSVNSSIPVRALCLSLCVWLSACLPLRQNTVTGVGNTEEFDFVICCTGHFSMPNVPSWPGLEHFPGRVMHAHDFRSAEEFEGRSVGGWVGRSVWFRVDRC